MESSKFSIWTPAKMRSSGPYDFKVEVEARCCIPIWFYDFIERFNSCAVPFGENPLKAEIKPGELRFQCELEQFYRVFCWENQVRDITRFMAPLAQEDEITLSCLNLLEKQFANYRIIHFSFDRVYKGKNPWTFSIYSPDLSRADFEELIVKPSRIKNGQTGTWIDLENQERYAFHGSTKDLKSLATRFRINLHKLQKPILVTYPVKSMTERTERSWEKLEREDISRVYMDTINALRAGNKSYFLRPKIFEELEILYEDKL